MDAFPHWITPFTVGEVMDGDDMPNEHAELHENEQDAVDSTLLRIDHEADATSSAVVISQGTLREGERERKKACRRLKTELLSKGNYNISITFHT